MYRVDYKKYNDVKGSKTIIIISKFLVKQMFDAKCHQTARRCLQIKYFLRKNLKCKFT